MSIEYVKHQAEKLNADLRKQRLASIAAGLGAMVLCVMSLLLPDSAIPGPLERLNALAAALIVCAGLYIGTQWRRRSQELRFQGNEGVTTGLEAYRSELRRRRDLYLGSWRWAIWPLLPAAAVLLFGPLLYDPRPYKALRFVVSALLLMGVTLAGRWANRRRASEFQRELDALESLYKA